MCGHRFSFCLKKKNIEVKYVRESKYVQFLNVKIMRLFVSLQKVEFRLWFSVICSEVFKNVKF